uniref:Rhomboid family protein n=1 Tax=Babesia bovis TaxID=5865 RepID=S6BK58_BABBO|nr:rhomboid family protein [Babesia bovis]
MCKCCAVVPSQHVNVSRKQYTMLMFVFFYMCIFATSEVVSLHPTAVVHLKVDAINAKTVPVYRKRSVKWQNPTCAESSCYGQRLLTFIRPKTLIRAPQQLEHASRYETAPLYSSSGIRSYARCDLQGSPTALAATGNTLAVASVASQISYLRDWVSAKSNAVARALQNARKTVPKPGIYLYRTCNDIMVKTERYCRTLVTKLHGVYLKAVTLKLKDLISFGKDPVLNIVRVVAMVYALDWWTGLTNIKYNFDLSPFDVFMKGQYYRLFTSLFLHNGVVHLLQNIRSLWAIGYEAADLLGPRRMLTIYLVSGLVANYISYVYYFAYKNAVPAHVFNATQVAVKGLGQMGMSTHHLVEKVVDRIRAKQGALSLPVFMASYLNDTIFHAVDTYLAPLIPMLNRRQALPDCRDVNCAVQQYIKRKCSRYRACGASAAIYGLMGAVCAYYARFGSASDRRRVTEIITSAVGQNIVALFGAKVDHVSHLAGFLTGMRLTRL